MSFAALAAIGIAVACILLGFLGYRAMVFRADGDETSTSDPRQL